MSTIALLHGNGKAQDRLRRAVAIDSVAGARHRLEPFRGWDQFTARMRSVESAVITIGIVDAYHTGEYGVGRIEQLRRECPSIPLIVYSNFNGRPAQEIALLVHAGVSRLITLDIDDHPTQIRDALAAVDASARARVAELLKHVVAEPATRLLLSVYDAVAEAMQMVNGGVKGDGNGHRGSSEIAAAAMQRLSEHLGNNLRRREVERSMFRLQLPPPAETVRLIRLIHVSRLLDDPGRTVANVAVATGFVEKTLYRSVLETSGLTPDALRKAGALTTMLRSIEARLRLNMQDFTPRVTANGNR